MARNSAGIKARQARVADIKLTSPEKSTRDIAKEVGVSHITVSRDWREMFQDETLREMVNELQVKSLVNAVEATDIEGSYVVQLKGRGQLTSQEVTTVSSIAEKNQKRYSFLKGTRSDDMGGDTEPLDMSREEIEKRLRDIKKLKIIEE